MQGTQVQFLGQEDPMKKGTAKGTATHSSIPAWEIPWTEKPGRLQSMGSQRVGHNSAPKLQQQQQVIVYSACSGEMIHVTLGGWGAARI